MFSRGIGILGFINATEITAFMVLAFGGKGPTLFVGSLDPNGIVSSSNGLGVRCCVYRFSIPRIRLRQPQDTFVGQLNLYDKTMSTGPKK